MLQSRPTANPRSKRKRKRTKMCLFVCFFLLLFFLFFFFFFFLLFSAYKNVKSFYTGKNRKKKKNAFCLWHVRPFILLFMTYAEPVHSSFRTPILPYRAQSLLNATGKMSLNWGLDCSSICSMRALAEFWTRNRTNNEI